MQGQCAKGDRHFIDTRAGQARSRLSIVTAVTLDDAVEQIALVLLLLLLLLILLQQQ